MARSESESDYNPNQQKSKKKKEKKTVVKRIKHEHCQELPSEIWEIIFSQMILTSSLFNLQLVCSRFNQILGCPFSKCWSNALQFYVDCQSKRMYTISQETALQIGTRTVMTLLKSTKCQVCRCSTYSIFWKF